MIAPAFAGGATQHLPAPPRIVVLGLGNVLVGDDAFGPFVARTIQARYTVPACVEVHDIGTPGLDLAPHIAGVESVIIVDTVKSKTPPGTVTCFSKAELAAKGPTPRTNPHQPGVVDTLFFLELQDMAPRDLLLVGVTPQRYDTGAPLSGPVRLAVNEAVSRVVCELERLGATPVPREVPDDPDIWWERPVRHERFSMT